MSSSTTNHHQPASTSFPPSPKIIDIISKESDRPFYVSLEYFPPRTEEGVKVRACVRSDRYQLLVSVEYAQVETHVPECPFFRRLAIFAFFDPSNRKNLYARMDRMKKALSPAFTDVTWGAGGSTADLSLDLALYLQGTGHVSNMHLTCTNLDSSKHPDPKLAVLQALQKAYHGGIRNIVALRGDPPAGQDEWKATEGGFACALDLVRFIREHKRTMDFGIAVAGYPEGHPNAITEVDDPTTLTETERARSSCFDGKTYCCLDADYQKELDYLKQKIEAGGGTFLSIHEFPITGTVSRTFD